MDYIKGIRLSFLILFTTIVTFSISHAEEEKSLIYVIDIKKEIDNTTWIYLNKGLKEAAELDARGVVLHMNTYGGLVNAADSMRTAILYSKVPVYVYIDNNAASAGALISIACKEIYMRKGANIGAATVVDQSGSAAPDKYQSYMRSMMRSTAEAHGKDTIIQGRDTIYKWKRDPLIAEAMVDDRVIVPGLIDTGKVLTFTAEEAIQWGYCEGIAESLPEVINKIGFTDYEIKRYTPTWLDNLKGFLMSPVLQSILILVIIGGIYFELQTPGMGFPSAAAITAAILYFSPLYIDGLAQNWEILIFLIGIVLIAVEIFVIPGFGIAGISGIILMITGLTLSLLDNVDFNFDGVSGGDITQAVFTVMAGMILSVVAMVWLSSRIGESGMFKRVALQTDLEEAISVPIFVEVIGKEGIAATVLRPSGSVEVEGELYDAVSESGFIEKGTPVRVTRTENAQVYVEEIRS